MMDWHERSDDRPPHSAPVTGEPLEANPAEGTKPAAGGELSPGAGASGPPTPTAATPDSAHAVEETSDGGGARTPAAPGNIGFIPRITVGAFAETEALAEALRRAGSDRRMARTVFEFVSGNIESAAEHFREAPTPDLIVVESRLDRGKLFAALERLAEHCPPGTRLIVVGHDNDVALYRRLLKLGVGDYLVAPVDPLGVIDAIAQLFEEGDADRLGKVTAFIGARGGAGSSTVAQNTAAAMARHCDSSVLLIDLDLPFGSAGLDLNMETAQGVRDALEQGERLDGTLLDRLVTQRDGRIGLLAAPCNLSKEHDPDPEAVRHLIDTARAITPHLLIDLPHCWTGWIRKALLAADEIVLTATPDLTALRNARNIVRAARAVRLNDPAPRLVLNQIGVPKRREVTPADYERVLEMAPTALIRHDPVAFSTAAANGELLVETGVNTEATIAFDRLARLVTGQKEPEPAARGLGRWARLVRKSA